MKQHNVALPFTVNSLHIKLHILFFYLHILNMTTNSVHIPVNSLPFKVNNIHLPVKCLYITINSLHYTVHSLPLTFNCIYQRWKKCKNGWTLFALICFLKYEKCHTVILTTFYCWYFMLFWGQFCHILKLFLLHWWFLKYKKKSCIRETKHLSTDADSSTKNTPKPFF